MRAFIKKYDVLTIGFSLMAAFILWIFVINAENPVRTQDFNDVSINILGKNIIKERYNLSVIDSTTDVLNVKVSAQNDIITKLKSNQIKSSIDISNITGAGTYTLPVKIELPSAFYTLKSQNIAYIDVSIDKIIEKTLDIVVDKNINIDDKNYIYSKPTTDKTQVVIKGAKNILDNIAYAFVSTGKITKSTVEKYDYILMNNDDKEVISEYVEKISEKIIISIEVQRIKEIPLVITKPPNLSSDYVTISPTKVKIIGESAVVENISNINIGDISGDINSEKLEYKFKIEYPNGVSPYEETAKYAKVIINKSETPPIPPISQPEIEAPTPPVIYEIKLNNIKLIDTSLIDPKKIELITVGMLITLEGKDIITENEISATASINSSDFEAGIKKVKIDIKLPEGKDVVVLGEYEAEVEVK